MENTELEGRIAKLEKQGASRFFVQYLLSPLLVLVVGAFMNWRVESNRQNIESARSEIQRIELAQKMLPNLFSNNASEAFATQRLMQKVLDPEMAKEIVAMVENYYREKYKSDVEGGDTKSAVETLTAAQRIGGASADQFAQSVTQQNGNATIQQIKTGLQLAAEKEREGFENLIHGKYGDAAKSFQESTDAYATYHNSAELARLIKDRGYEMSDGTKRKEVFQVIIDKYSWGVPQDLLNQLKEMAK